jgi:beta-glucosidase
LEKPVRELKAFAKTKNLKPGESQTLTLKVTNYELASYNEKAVAWQAAKGNYSIQICKNASEVALTLPYKLKKTQSWKTTNSLALQAPLKEISLKKK